MWSAGFKDVAPSRKRKRAVQEQKPLDLDLLYEPHTIDELATHTRKIAEVKEWLLKSAGRCSMLLLTGPAGSGKTVTLKVLAQSLNIYVQEWVNPVDKIEYEPNAILDNSFDRNAYFEPKQTDKFESFIFQSSRYQTLFSSGAKRLILLEDFPNYFIWKPKVFHEFLSKYKRMGQCPVIFICTDDEKVNLSHTLFSVEVRNYFGIDNIKFNPVANTALLKILKQYSPKMSKEQLDVVAKNSNGDIRVAIASLRFSKPNKSCEGTVSKDILTDYYKMLGRILYPKRLDEPSPLSKQFLYDLNDLTDYYSDKVMNMLHENYLGTFSKMENVIEASDVFSFCDLLSTKGQELNSCAALLCITGLMCANKQPAKGSFKPLSRSRVTEHSRNFDKAYRPYPELSVTNRVLNLDYITYLPMFPSFATRISSFDSDRFRSLKSNKKIASHNIFKAPYPVPQTDNNDEELLIEEFDD